LLIFHLGPADGWLGYFVFGSPPHHGGYAGLSVLSVSRPGFFRTRLVVAQASGRGGAVTAGEALAAGLAARLAGGEIITLSDGPVDRDAAEVGADALGDTPTLARAAAVAVATAPALASAAVDGLTVAAGDAPPPEQATSASPTDSQAIDLGTLKAILLYPRGG
jgi:hypothetical protein